MGDEHFDTIPDKESDELIKSSVENLVPIPSESEDFSDNESECDELMNIALKTPNQILRDLYLNRDSSIDLQKHDSIFDEFSLPRPPEESNYEYSNATNESLSPSPIPAEDIDPFMEEIDIFLA
ncbi:hypothetical protein Tco_0484339 [Tanacetum coccineum]